MTVSAAFASDNAAPVHPAVLDALIGANADPVSAYGKDPYTEHATQRLRDLFASPDAEVLFALTGTAANVIALSAATRPWHEILCSDIAHALLDEAGGPVRISGAQLTRLPSDDGLIDPAELERRVARRGDVHHSHPSIVTITQSTENGRVWTASRLREFVDRAHELDLLVHIDGARIANAIAALDLDPAEAIADADVVTVGGTKNGQMFGDAVLVRRPERFDGIRFVQKQIGQLASKQRFVAAQFEAMLTDGLWLQTAAHANTMAARLSRGLTAMGLRLAAPTEANEVFVQLDPAARERISGYAVHQPDALSPVFRLVCSWATTEEQVSDVLQRLRG
ncbi:threonine aldolase family protein [[Mycobacterium] wendilense]|uniref:Beta-eliminating lyase-related protein n=1 Tax=[Mycobacterium] wendilense TaxID=3064284 RepID=A0ABM9MCE3_9MYCO|nr:aminotransferase class I/II-fold pyridoxal phosphate-dependent enzyme [Mycolicibacterium sp. MU0050]CAJ1581792.1 beta-eliminating lyase-related protein [Mycolicibacterium sp. MU0050]